MYFTAGCNEQVFSPKPWKNFGADSCCRSGEKRKNRFHKMTSLGPGLMLLTTLNRNN